LSKKGARANAQKVDQAAARLESATQQWESQAPFIFETLQALDEQRINHLRDVLTQFETHEVDQATRAQAAAEEVLNVMLEVNTAQEIQNFVQRTTAGKPKVERRSTSRQQTPVGPSAASPSVTGDDISEHSAHRDNPPGTVKTDPWLASSSGPLLIVTQRHQSYGVALEPCLAVGVRVFMAASASLVLRRRALVPSPGDLGAATARRCLPQHHLTT
jgi:hypothetical protein